VTAEAARRNPVPQGRQQQPDKFPSVRQGEPENKGRMQCSE
jgi:hypothetical protein